MEPRCANCGVLVHERPEREGAHSIQMEYRADDGGMYCEACFFQDSYDRDGVAIVAEELSRTMRAGETADALEGAYTKDHLRSTARILDIPLERGITKRGVAEELADRRQFFVTKKLVGDRVLG